MIAAQSSAPQKLSDWLSQFGWESTDHLQSEFQRPTPKGYAFLRKSPAASQSSWNQWSLESPMIPAPDRSGILRANHQLLGPWKFVATPDGEILCRGDVPRDVFLTDDSFDLATGQTSSPLECWAEATTAIAKGLELATSHSKPSPQNLIDWLKERGFVASADGDKVKVTVPLSGAFREVSIAWQENGLACLSAELGRLETWEESSILAADDFLQEANRRLRLARIARPDEQKTYSMEVCFRAQGPGVWLQSGVEALCTGMALVVQPLATLRDPGVADMLLAGKLAKNEGGVP